MPSSRRRFLSGAVSTAFAAPFVTTGLRAASPNGKLRHASFGSTGMAGSDINSLSSHPMFELVAVCDVDSRNLDKMKAARPNVRLYQDWRELLAKEADNIDSVNVSTPDHMHGIIGIEALKLGKHMYGQKPLAQNLWECRQLMLKAREKNVMTQMGIQISSEFTERYAVEMIRTGAIGKVKEAHTFSNKKWGDLTPVPAPTEKDVIPAGFDWQKWLGPAADRPYLGGGYYHPGTWRKRRDFGTGTLGDMGCHMFSGWFRAMDFAAPIGVKHVGQGASDANWAINAQVEYTFKSTQYTDGETVRVTWYDGDSKPPAEVLAAVDYGMMSGEVPANPSEELKKGQKISQGTIYIGTEGAMFAPHGSRPILYPRAKYAQHPYPQLEPRNHYKDFIDCCLGGKQKPSANFDYAAPLTEAVLLGCLASVVPGEALTWDSPGLSIPNNENANALVKRKYRDGWEPKV